MPSPLLDRRHLLNLIGSTGLLTAVPRLTGCVDLPEPCEPRSNDPAVSWGPSVLRPVFYGYADYDGSTGAPTELRVYYPSLDGSPACGSFLTGSGRWPLVVFLHGECNENEAHYSEWFRLPATLARCGYVTVLPNLNPHQDPTNTSNSNYALITDVIDWMFNSWSKRAYLMPGKLGMAGHSWGALHAGKVANDQSADVYVSLGGTWTDWLAQPDSPLTAMTLPRLIAWGDQDWSAIIPDGNWNALPTNRHKLVFTDGQHWDVVPGTSTICEGGDPLGPCTLTADLAADLAAIFLSKHMPPEDATDLGGIGNDLSLPSVTLTGDQVFYAGAHLTSLSTFGPDADCDAALSWVTSSGSGSATF